jgi:hypothetical protein
LQALEFPIPSQFIKELVSGAKKKIPLKALYHCNILGWEVHTPKSSPLQKESI